MPQSQDQTQLSRLTLFPFPALDSQPDQPTSFDRPAKEGKRFPSGHAANVSLVDIKLMMWINETYILYKTVSQTLTRHASIMVALDATIERRLANFI